jgi:CRISPR-associated protein Csb1
MQLTADALVEGCADDAFDAGVTIAAALEPLAGDGAPVKPAVYLGGRYQVERRWWGAGDDRRIVAAVVIDNEASQANRNEHALKVARGALGLPELVVDLGAIDALPAHLPRSLSSFDLPHRNGDAYLRDAVLDGAAFPKTKLGAAIFAASDRNPAALYQWMPQSLVYGFWQSHLGKKRQQTKLARSWSSSIVGYDPAVDSKASPDPGGSTALPTWEPVLGVKGDPLGLSIGESVQRDEDDQLEWALTSDARSKARKSGESLAEIGHGQVPVGGSPPKLSFAAIEQRATISFARLRTIVTGSPDADAAGRALLAAIALAGHTFASGRAMSLRSGCDLRPSSVSWTWLGGDADTEVEPLTREGATDLVRDCASRAEAAGLPVGSRWAAEPLRLEPNTELAKVIKKAWPLSEVV